MTTEVIGTKQWQCGNVYSDVVVGRYRHIRVAPRAYRLSFSHDRRLFGRIIYNQSRELHRRRRNERMKD